MLYEICFSGSYLIEADSEEEARASFEDEDMMILNSVELDCIIEREEN